MNPLKNISKVDSFIKGIPILIWLFGLVIIPLTFTFIMSFYSSDGSIISKSLSLTNYKTFFTDALYSKILFKTIRLALLISILSILAAYPLAYLVSFKIKRGRNALFMLSIIPLWVSYLVRIIAWRSILGNKGLINNFLLSIGLIDSPLSFLLYNQFAIAITLTYICIPFVFIPVYTALEKIPRNILEASSDLGAGEIKSFFNIVLPLSIPGLITGFIFSFIISLGDYIIPSQLGGIKGMMFGNLIWSQFGFAYNWPMGAALGFVLFAISVAILGSTSKYGSTEGGFLGE
jgi:spermidine/putrescine transport system permease protein